MGVVSLRLEDKEIRHIEEVAKREGKKKTDAMRELIECGYTYLLISLYREGKYSLGKVAKELDLSISETIDLLADFGITAPLEYEDYLKGYETLKEVF